MAEYGRIVGEGSGVGGRSGPTDLTGQVFGALSDLVDRVTALPPEILLGAAAVILIAGWLFMRR